eukprot:SM001162S25671  [mRNA]  locus=s1162:710:1953:- [translate_table: standard]
MSGKPGGGGSSPVESTRVVVASDRRSWLRLPRRRRILSTNKSFLELPLRPRSKPVAEDQDGEARDSVETEKSRAKQAMAFLARAVRQACKLPGLLTRTAGELLLSLLGFAAAVVGIVVAALGICCVGLILSIYILFLMILQKLLGQTSLTARKEIACL